MCDTKVPGPGNYSIPSRAIEGRNISLSGRYRSDKPEIGPGPAAYN